MKIQPEHRLAILLHGGIRGHYGKTGLTMLRYSKNRIVAVIDVECAGLSLRECTGIDRDAPLVASVEEARLHEPDVLVIGIAPSGGRLPPEWIEEIGCALRSGMSVVSGLHTRLADTPCMGDGQWIWDVRREPENLPIGRGAAAALPCTRVLTVGTDMAIGKKCTALEMNECARRRGLKSKFLASGQSGIMICGEGIAIDSVRVDYAAGAVEQMTLQAAGENDLLILEGQGSLLHPGSTATGPLIRGMQPTHLILVHRAGQERLRNCPELIIPPLDRVVRLYEDFSAAAGMLTPSRVAAVALNTRDLDAARAREAIRRAAEVTGLPCTDPVRCGAEMLLDAVLVPKKDG